MAKVKGYIASNMDGRVSAMVAATSLAQAAEKMRTSVYSLRQMGWSQAKGDDLSVALASPDTVHYRPIIAGPARKPWTTDRKSLGR